MKDDSEWNAIDATLIRLFFLTVSKSLFHTVMSDDVPTRRHAKRKDKPKTASSALEATAAGMLSATSTIPSSTSCATGTAPPGLQYSMFGSGFANSFDPATLSPNFHARLLFADSDAYGADGCAQQHYHQAHVNGMEQWAAAQMDSFPFMHARDHQMSGPPTDAMPITVEAMQGMWAELELKLP
ncbi:unnamed protein product [Triticum turgidum subsp. durum]|uniref:Uncharacterized protein n=1 Tax=Triticum turgidum subsp. durum TaxID=4567 RepID=A0A9R0S1K3_TRITD|nr:unnamed protein product [Triticum turgidum subsp. durum]